MANFHEFLLVQVWVGIFFFFLGWDVFLTLGGEMGCFSSIFVLVFLKYWSLGVLGVGVSGGEFQSSLSFWGCLVSEGCVHYA